MGRAKQNRRAARATRPSRHRASSSNRPIVAYARHQLRLIERYFDLTPQTQLLEIGYGFGWYDPHLGERCQVQRIDTPQTVQAHHPIDDVAVMEPTTLDFADDSFDVVFSHHTLHHLSDPLPAVKEIARISRRYVVLVEPNQYQPWNLLGRLAARAKHRSHPMTLRYLVSLGRRSRLYVMDAFCYGVLMPGRTPALLLPLARMLNFEQPFGHNAFLVAEKMEPTCASPS